MPLVRRWPASGSGGDGGNYPSGGIQPPSKIDGTRTYDAGTVRAR